MLDSVSKGVRMKGMVKAAGEFAGEALLVVLVYLVVSYLFKVFQ